MDNTHKRTPSSVNPARLAVPQVRVATTKHPSNSITARQAVSLEGNTEVGKNKEVYVLDTAEALDPNGFPNPPRTPGGSVPTTIPNVDHLLRSYGITVRYNVIKKRLAISIPGLSGAPDNADNSALTQIFSLATLNGMSVGQIPSIVEAIGDRHLLNPVADWIGSKSWDGIDRLQEFYNTLIEREDYPRWLKERLVHRWLISAVAAAFKPDGFRTRGVLTIQGPQSIGKTAWIGALVNDPVLKEALLKLNHHLDASNKDSIITATCHWIDEIGE